LAKKTRGDIPFIPHYTAPPQQEAHLFDKTQNNTLKYTSIYKKYTHTKKNIIIKKRYVGT